jgi:DNA-binding response OmpR family regulator
MNELVLDRVLWRGAPPGHVALCPHCHQPMLPDAITKLLPPRQLELFRIIAESGNVGVDKHEIMRLVFGDEKDFDLKIVASTARHVNKKLRPYGLVLNAGRGRGALWRLERIKC